MGTWSMFNKKESSHEKPGPSILPEGARELIKTFLNQRNSEDFSYALTLNQLEYLFENAKNDDDIMLSLLEDCVISSLMVTYFEIIFKTIYQNPKLYMDLIDKFSKDCEIREKNVSQEAQNHLEFILKGGSCQGCSSCSHHSDVAILVQKWENQDLDFFVNLYIGMQTILFAMENILYDILPINHEICQYMLPENILHLRKFIFKFTEDQQPTPS